jgi:hypothetical protein
MLAFAPRRITLRLSEGSNGFPTHQQISRKPVMSLFRWLFPAKKSKAAAAGHGHVRTDAHRAGARRDGATANAQPASRKNERMARRELLYAVVRQSMTRAGVLSSGYKFKVLSLDPKGHQFLVMIDLARTYGGEAARLADIEAMIAQAAKTRHNLLVDGVYWRTNEHVAVGDPAAQKSANPQRPENSQPAALDSQPGSLESAPGGLGAEAPRVAPRFEPIQADEVTAFKNALAAGVTAPEAMAAAAPARAGAGARAFDGSGKHGPQSYTLLTGFEDTELPDARTPVLSGTQYGELN